MQVYCTTALCVRTASARGALPHSVLLYIHTVLLCSSIEWYGSVMPVLFLHLRLIWTELVPNSQPYLYMLYYIKVYRVVHRCRASMLCVSVRARRAVRAAKPGCLREAKKCNVIWLRTSSQLRTFLVRGQVGPHRLRTCMWMLLVKHCR